MKILEVIKSSKEINNLLETCPKTILNKMTLENYESGKFVLNQDKVYQQVYILVKGAIEISLLSAQDKKVILDIYQKPGLFIGEQEAILDRPYSATVSNLTSCQLISMPSETFLEWLSCDRDFSKWFIYNQCDQVYHITRRVERYTLYNAKEQVAMILLDYYQNDQLITKFMLQRSLIITVRHLNRILADLVEQDIISINKSVITVLNCNKLSSYGEE